jgi:predicted HTH transcriptional regulator
MTPPKDQTVPRQPEDPQPQDLLDEMNPCEPYTANDLQSKFDASRWTIQRRLKNLHEDDKIRKKKHAENRVSWWIPSDG